MDGKRDRGVQGVYNNEAGPPQSSLARQAARSPIDRPSQGRSGWIAAEVNDAVW
jgi:hypothetical protein